MREEDNGHVSRETSLEIAKDVSRETKKQSPQSGLCHRTISIVASYRPDTNCQRALMYTLMVCSPGLTGVGTAASTFRDIADMSYIGRGGTVGPCVDSSISAPSEP